MASTKQGSNAGELRQLRAKVRELTSKLAKETSKRKTDVRRHTISSKQTSAVVAKQLAALKEKGRHLASELSKALGDAGRRQKAREEALAKLSELREDLRRKTDELRRKSIELAKLARESAERAREIITEPAPHPSAPPTAPLTPWEAPGHQSGPDKPPEGSSG